MTLFSNIIGPLTRMFRDVGTLYHVEIFAMLCFCSLSCVTAFSCIYIAAALHTLWLKLVKYKINELMLLNTCNLAF